MCICRCECNCTVVVTCGEARPVEQPKIATSVLRCCLGASLLCHFCAVWVDMLGPVRITMTHTRCSLVILNRAVFVSVSYLPCWMFLSCAVSCCAVL